MTKFHIKELIVSGKQKQTSTISFKKGLNIICGPSNTGKSYILECIDYFFGSSEIRFDKNTGYDTFKLIVATEKGDISFERKIDSNPIEVLSENPLIESRTYIRDGKYDINDVWLKLIGITEKHRILRTQGLAKQRLTWRTFQHILLIKEDDVFIERSPLLSTQNTAKTPALAAIYFLITGEDFSDFDFEKETLISNVKKKALEEYINNQLKSIAKRKQALSNIKIQDEKYIQNEVNKIVTKIQSTEEQINDAMSNSKIILNQIYTLNEKLAEANTLHNRYNALKTQYISDIQRLTFIIEGEFHDHSNDNISNCPFCNGAITSSDKQLKYLKASQSELSRIKVQLEDLSEAEKNLLQDKEYIEIRLKDLTNKRDNVEKLIEDELTPKLTKLNEQLEKYKETIEIKNEANIIKQLESTLIDDLKETLIVEEEIKEIKIKTYYDKNVVTDFENKISHILKECMGENLSSVYFDTNKYDIVINGKAKRFFGKGYRAFFNTILSLSLLEYIKEHGKYSPGFLAIDSPILSLKEKDDDVTPDTMKNALFEYFNNHQQLDQIIIIENEIPNVDYSRANIIEFSKDKNKGRYGFLYGVHD